MICKSTRESVTRREKLGSTETALNGSLKKQGRAYILGGIGSLGACRAPEKMPGLRNMGGGHLDDRGAHLVALSFTPLTHNVRESTC